MPFYDERPTRVPNRIDKKDYSRNGAYFITICTKERHNFLGRICDGKMQPSEIGAFAVSEIARLEKIYPSVVLDSFVLMPNHVHMLVILLSETQNPAIHRIVQQWKGVVSKKAEFPLWQDRFHDVVIYDAAAYRNIKQYIETNPAHWEDDCFYENQPPPG